MSKYNKFSFFALFSVLNIFSILFVARSQKSNQSVVETLSFLTGVNEIISENQPGVIFSPTLHKRV